MSRLTSALLAVNTAKYRTVAIVGDVHGDYKSLTSLQKIVDLDIDLLVFLGDYADRGAEGVEVIRKVAQLRNEHPSNVIALMGNHEDYSEDGYPQFNPSTLIDEAEKKWGSWNRFFKDVFKPFVDSLPLAALIPGNALLVHAGVSSHITGIKALEHPSPRQRRDMLWSDPFDGKGEHPSIRGAGVEFGKDISTAVCKSLGVERIIRSHQPSIAMEKPNITHDGRVITVQCTSVYGGQPFVYFINPKTTKKDNYQQLKSLVPRIWEIRLKLSNRILNEDN